jgi:hypothetical protein
MYETLGIAGYFFLSAVAKADAGQNTSNNHLTPNVLYMMLATGFICFQMVLSLIV